jgi:glycosyltransferase involved in cell wall biosynthesis
MLYVLITPARNEESFIENTIRSVVSQTVIPQKWVIVSDGSTDRTDEIVKKYTRDHPWIELVRMPEHRDRQFAAKVHCFNAGFEKVKNTEYNVIGNLDADVSFEKDYIEFLLDRFAGNPKLGVAGTPYIENKYNSASDSFEGENFVNGAIQLFRRQCFEDIGGYIPHKGGGIDWIAVTTARMKGWETRSFREKYFYHYRPSGTADRNIISASFLYGKKDYTMGGHPLWLIFRMMYRMTKRPLFLGGIALMLGYVTAFATRIPRPISPELMKFHRQEQLTKLKCIIMNILRFQKIDKSIGESK